jgi:LacI family transcriptional regulator
MRSKHFMARMAHHGLAVDDHFILKGDFIVSETREAVSRLVKSGKLPTAIVSANDDMALAATDTFKAHQIRVPEDISIIGYDDAPVSAVVKPSLTTVQVPFFRYGTAGC